MPDFAGYIRQLRQKQRLSLRDVAQKTGISYSYLAQIEQGRRNPPGPDFMKRLAPVYQVTLKDLLRAAGYLEENEPSLSDEQEVEMAFNYVMNDPRYHSGTRMTGELTTDVKRFIVEMYEKATGKKLLPGRSE
ncbi:Helix-turn-helix domain-containing protein [Dehalogenimonas formicexedens]|uniref:Helix-turn-helix domain-containing protein n=2 Tax=Dehalogenimonas TaxID=670486 RepID=A0A1P8F9W9_9CHLR|nr:MULTISPECIES: helix-turn-helix transcriptional regulator [Dehalogenimonas]APV45257.1 Helix-turn-helix domain-containing protein [Dehalogenimonas formicexedens]KTB49070.1 Helix-turn-helix domain [Dehalogenimonas alkenigignens]